MEKIISGIQQMGIGVPNVEQAWAWYRKFFGVNVKVFEEAADAPLMTKYTGGVVHSRTATLALSMNGGGGFEIWQFTSRPTEKANFEVQLGDFGLYICKIKSYDVQATFDYFTANQADIQGSLYRLPNGKMTFYVKDPNGNLFQIVEGRGWFGKNNHPSKCGGVAGVVIGVSNIEKSLHLYQNILEYDQVEYDEKSVFKDFEALPSGKGEFRRVLLTHSKTRKGPFAKLLGPTEIELVESIDRSNAQSIFKDRFWGDWGFIHLCFDVQRMGQLEADLKEGGFPFTVDSSDTFDMGEAGGRFSYIEDPDGTWIEFVETHKVPIFKKLGLYVHLKKRNPEKSLPMWMLKAMGLNKKRD